MVSLGLAGGRPKKPARVRYYQGWVGQGDSLKVLFA